VGKRGITVIGFEARKYVVTGYQALGRRQFQEDRHVVTTMQLRLDIRQEGGPPGRHATLAVIEFGTGAANQIGQIARRPDPHAEEFELDLVLPAADFDHYWNILTDMGQTHLHCEVELPPGEDIAEFQIVSRKHTESVPS
jgi:hypothetical protein